MIETVAITDTGWTVAKGDQITTPLGKATFLGILSCKGATVIMARQHLESMWRTFTPSQVNMTIENVFVGELV